MSNIATTLANSADCMCCAAHSMSIIKLKKINAICIGCLSLLAIGSATFSTYFMYKIWKYQKKLAYLEKKLQSLKFNITEDNCDEPNEQLSDVEEEYRRDKDLDDLVETNNDEDDSNGDDGSSSLDGDNSSTASDYVVEEKKLNKKNEKSNAFPINYTKKNAITIASQIESSDEIAFETPVGSPDSSALEFLNRIETKKGFQLNEESKSCIQLDDNKCMDLIKCESYETVAQINQKRKDIYETVSYY
jgi:hypothetical protein